MPTQLTITPGEYLVNVECPCDGYGELPPEPPLMVRTMAIPEDGNLPYQPPPLPPADHTIESRISRPESSGSGVGFFPSTFFQLPVYPGSGYNVGSPLRGSYMNPNIPPYSPGWANTQYPRSGVYSGTPIPPSSGVPIGSPYAIIPGIVQNGATIEPMYRVDTRTGVREPLYQSPQGFAPTAPGIFAPTAPGIMRYETPPGYVPLAPGIDTPEEWIMGFGTSQWDRYNLTAGKPDEIDTTEDWIYGYDRDAINDPRTNFSLSQSLEKLPFGVFSWDRNPLVTQ